MGYAMYEGNKFLIDDPNWAEDFAPNGMCFGDHSKNGPLQFSGVLVKLGDTMTRKRYAA
jgi:hypothetical protein